jgi:hypothetical protein
MKNYKYILPFLFASLFFSCAEDYLDVIPDNVGTIDNAFSNRFNAFKYLRTCYSYLPDASSVNNTIGLNVGDEIKLPTLWDERNGPSVTNGFLDITNPKYDFWNGTNGGKPLYEGIRHCNVFLEQIDNVQELEDSEKTTWIAEVKFLKAYYHFYLLRMYGPIVINKELIKVTDDYNNDAAIARHSIDEGFLYVVELLDEAIPVLPVRIANPNEELGRITQAIAASIKARVLMTYASPLFNGNTVFNELKNAEGESLFPQNYDEEKWQLAATACKEAIDMCSAAGISLFQKEDYLSAYLPTYTEETKLNSALRLRVTGEWNKELIWGYTGNSSNSLQVECFPRLENYDRSPVGMKHGPPLRIAETYYTENGVPIKEDINYDYANRYRLRTALAEDKQFIEEGEETAILNFDREARFYADLGFDRGTWFENGRFIDDTNPWILHSRFRERNAGVHSASIMVTGYLAKKLLHPKSTVVSTTSGSASINRYAFPIIRLADLYLYYAEALNEVKGSPDGEVYEYIDLVRDRAELEGVVDSWNQYSNNPSKPLTKVGMREIIQQERLIEMSLEGRRYWDLRRWNLLKEKLNKPIKGWNYEGATVDEYYTIQTLSRPSFTEKDYFWPIKESELLNNPRLIQNIGW